MKNSRKKNKKKKSHLKKFFLIILSLLILLLVSAGGIVFAMIKTAPVLDTKQILDLDETSVIYDNKGNSIDDVITTGENGVVIKRTVIPFKSMPDNLKNAFISIEDERFRSHKGIDLKRIAGALFIDVKNKITHKSNNIQGGSTITQQLIKNRIFLDDSTQNRLSIKRKVQEAYLAVQLEKKLSKDQILEAYLNTIYLGGNAHGVEAAANQYFNKSAKDLSLVECAFLAGMNKGPSLYYPFSKSNEKDPSLIINRTKTVLSKMLENGFIDENKYESAIKDLDSKKLVFTQTQKNPNKYNYEWFSRPVVEQVKSDLKTQYNYSNKQITDLFMDGGLKIYTTMDKDIQDKAQNIIDNDPMFNNVYNENGKKVNPQAGASIMDYHTGEVKALIGGRGSQAPGSYNRAYSSNFRRAVGSSIKPLTVYSPAIDTEMATAATVIDDSPLDSSIGKKYLTNGKPYDPKNDTGTYSGPQTLRNALKESINVIAVKLEDQLGLNVGAKYADKFGITLDSVDKSSISALSLGQLHYGTNPLTMAAAYGVFGNNGVYSYPILYTKVVDKSGKVILESKYKTKKVLSPQSAYIMYDLLKGPVSDGGTGPGARFANMVRGKTGTATDSKDLWFCGLTTYYSGAVWIGNDDYSKFYGLGSNNSAILWGKLMQEANKNLSDKEVPMPSGITTASIDSATGKLASGRSSNVFQEIFINGTAPTDYDTTDTN